MTKASWIGLERDGLASGDFFTAANWSTSTVPGGDTDATLGAGSYQVAVDASDTLRSLSVGAGVGVVMDGSGDVTISLGGNSRSYGTMQVATGGLTLA